MIQARMSSSGRMHCDANAANLEERKEMSLLPWGEGGRRPDEGDKPEKRSNLNRPPLLKGEGTNPLLPP